ncbi:SigB/SigF/SigG family RNA polymerase sigma factor [Spirillospora sp. NPDC047279]|uniref:SigB/SigF/SigG family RNA polymerase sigma factor n=1 Tax=Spirillospora sp. NPDC047279 TaxID=3155478 RepID=UPI0033FA6402
MFDGRAEALLAEIADLPEDDPGRDRLREELVRMHTSYVRHVVNRYRSPRESVEDLEQTALLGLVKAINGFDPEVGPRFLPYASMTVAGEIKRHYRDRTWVVHVSRRVQELRLRVRHARDDFNAEHGRAPTVPELAAFLDVEEDEVAEAVAADSAYQPASLDLHLTSDDDDSQTLGETIGETDADLEGVVDHESLKPLMAELPERERHIVQLRFWGNLTQAQIATRIGVSQMHVSRLLRKTLDQLRDDLLT